MAVSHIRPTTLAAGELSASRCKRQFVTGVDAMPHLVDFARQAADCSPDVARIALLRWASASRSAFPMAVVLRESTTREDLRAIRSLLHAASIPAREAGVDLVLHVLPKGHPQSGDGITLWPPMDASDAPDERPGNGAGEQDGRR